MSNKTLIEWNADVGTRFLTIHPDGSFDIDKDAPPLFVIGELAKAFIRQQDRIKRLEDGDAALAYSIGLDLQKENEALKARIKRLEEAGDRMFSWSERVGQEYWTKAKEDKP